MGLRIVSGSANPMLAHGVAAELDAAPGEGPLERFPDGELRPAVGDVRGDDVYVVQPTGPPVNDNLVELALLIDACRRAGAERITAVLPYLGYARQDRRTGTGQPIGARVSMEVLAAVGADRAVVLDPHNPAIEAMSPVPVDVLTALPDLAGTLRPLVPPGAVIVAPDLGAVQLAERCAALLDGTVAVVRKARRSGTEVVAADLVGEVAGRRTAVVDDMISTGGTVEAAVQLLRTRGADPEIVVAALHGVLAGDCIERLADLRLERLLLTDSVTPVDTTPVPSEVHRLAPLLAEAVGRMHRDEPLDGLLAVT